MTTEEVEARDDSAVERKISDTVAGIEAHVTALENLLCQFCEDEDDEGRHREEGHDAPPAGDDNDWGAGLAHMKVLARVFDDLIEGRLQPGWEQHPIWSEKERNTWSPFATEVTNLVHAIPPLILKVQELWTRTSRPYGFNNMLFLGWRIRDLSEHQTADEDYIDVSREASSEEDALAYEEYRGLEDGVIAGP
jgi:hypothetical protein